MGGYPVLRRHTGIALVGAAIAMLGAAGPAFGYRGDGVFTLPGGPPSMSADVAMLADGSVVVGGDGIDSGTVVAVDGRRSRLPDDVWGGFAATADGSLLAVQSDHRVRRWTPDVGVSVIAGTGVAGFGGDGGPATEALLDLIPYAGQYADPDVFPVGLVARADGGFVFPDPGNHRIRAVDGAGVIRTVAGGSRKLLDDPVGLAATRDSGYIVTENLGSRVRRIRPDGAIETVARLDGADDVVVLDDGSAVISQYWESNLWRLAPGGRRLRPYLRPQRTGETFDFAARETLGRGLGVDLHGGLLVAGPDTRDERRAGGRLTYVPHGPTPWTLVALRQTRTTPRGVTAVIEATQPGMATLEVMLRHKVIARVAQAVAAGHSTLRAVGQIRARWYDVRVRLESPNSATAHDEVPIHGAQRLTIPLARKMLGRDQGNIDGTIFYKLGRHCQAFGSRRVDCEIGDRVGVASVTLGRSGVALRRHYNCGRVRFRRHPRYIPAPFDIGVQRLSRDDGGFWAAD